MEEYKPVMLSSTSVLSPPKFKVPLLSGIPSRGITYETTRRYCTYAGDKPLQIYHEYYSLDLQELCGVKYREGGWTVGKKKTWWDAGSQRSLFGSHLYEGESAPVYLFEGETDAMAWSQLEPESLCLAYGGKPSPETLAEWQIYLATVSDGHSLTLCFDMDEEGDKYTSEFLDTWQGAPLSYLHLPPDVKDAAQLLIEGGTVDIRPLVYHPPDFILTGEALLSAGQHVGKSYTTSGHKELDMLVGGYAPGKLFVVAGPPKSGKSSFVADLTAKFVANHTGRVLVIPLELSCTETMQILSAATLGKHITSVSDDELEAAEVQLAGRIVMARHFGFMPIDKLDAALKCIPRMGVKLVVLDHITAAATSFTEGLTVNLLDAMISLIQARLNEYGIPGIVVTHTNASGNHGEMMGVSSIRGSQSLAQLASTVLGIRRLESGLSEVYTIVPDRFVGRMGRVTFEFDGSFNALNRKTSDL